MEVIWTNKNGEIIECRSVVKVEGRPHQRAIVVDKTIVKNDKIKVRNVERRRFNNKRFGAEIIK